VDNRNIRVGYKCVKAFVCTRKNDGHLVVSEFEVGDLVPSSIYAELNKSEQKNFVRNDDLLGQVYAGGRG
jgi:hypothetical protein